MNNDFVVRRQFVNDIHEWHSTEHNWWITSRVTTDSLFMVGHTLSYFVRYFVVQTHWPDENNQLALISPLSP